ncbi:hypothetical protein XF24_00039 [candidate division SR1 bacterium Aalborg_AAW-1]|nr:hypothetical protein XF24_00039 [candidate division SR1 bacterium Aalborg_AAW-1]
MKKLKDIYWKNFLYADTLLGIFLSILYFFSIGKYGSFGNNNIIDVAAIYFGLAGLLLATFSIIFSFKDGEKIQFLQANKNYKEVYNIFQQAIVFSLLFGTLFIMISFGINLEFIGIKIHNIIIFTIVILGIKLWRCLRILKNLFNLSLPKG